MVAPGSQTTRATGYPVTPATEVLEAAAREFPKHARTFIPAEGEIGAINIVAGASLGGYRSMTATSGLGLSLMAEGLSFYSGMTELSGVIVVQQRWGPGDGSLGPGQDCYNQATRGAGHGDFALIVLAPKSVQELADHVTLAFDLADKHSLFVLVLGDQIVAMTSEQYEVSEPAEPARRDTAFGDIASFLAAGATSPGVAQRDSYGVMCALHNNWFDRFYALLRPGGVLVADASCITASMRNRGDVTNLVAAGAVAALSQIATPEALEQGMNAVVPPHRADRIAANLAAVRAGYDWAANNALRAPA